MRGSEGSRRKRRVGQIRNMHRTDCERSTACRYLDAGTSSLLFANGANAAAIRLSGMAVSSRLSVAFCIVATIDRRDDGLQTGGGISGPVLAVNLLLAIFAIIGRSELQHFMECIAWWQGATASAGIAARTTSNPATNLANRPMLVAPRFPELASAVCDLNHSQPRFPFFGRQAQRKWGQLDQIQCRRKSWGSAGAISSSGTARGIPFAQRRDHGLVAPPGWLTRCSGSQLTLGRQSLSRGRNTIKVVTRVMRIFSTKS